MKNTNSDRPLVTFALFAYNQEQYIREAVEGAFSQTYSPLEIILSDDCSSDRTFDVIRTMAAEYQGGHRIIVRKSEKNRGLLAHINDVFQSASGEIVVVAAGDDISLPDRTLLSANAFASHRDLKAIFTDFIEVGESPVRISMNVEIIPIEKIAFNGGGVGKGATYAYHRDCFMTPTLLPHSLLSEDRILPLRAAMLGSVGQINVPTVIYRRTPASSSVFLRATGRLPADLPGHIDHLVDEIKITSKKIKSKSSTCGPIFFLRAKMLLTRRKSDGRLTRVVKSLVSRAIYYYLRNLPQKVIKI